MLNKKYSQNYDIICDILTMVHQCYDNNNNILHFFNNIVYVTPLIIKQLLRMNIAYYVYYMYIVYYKLLFLYTVSHHCIYVYIIFDRSLPSPVFYTVPKKFNDSNLK